MRTQSYGSNKEILVVSKTLDDWFSNFFTAWHIQKMIIFVSHSEMNWRRFKEIDMGLGEKKIVAFPSYYIFMVKKEKENQ